MEKKHFKLTLNENCSFLFFWDKIGKSFPLTSFMSRYPIHRHRNSTPLPTKRVLPPRFLCLVSRQNRVQCCLTNRFILPAVWCMTGIFRVRLASLLDNSQKIAVLIPPVNLATRWGLTQELHASGRLWGDVGLLRTHPRSRGHNLPIGQPQVQIQLQCVLKPVFIQWSSNSQSFHSDMCLIDQGYKRLTRGTRINIVRSNTLLLSSCQLTNYSSCVFDRLW